VQVVALCQAPFLLDDPNVGLIFPADAIARAKHYLAMAPGGLGNIYHIVVKKTAKG
jgi:glutamate--glyoxylate aminotransferase